MSLPTTLTCPSCLTVIQVDKTEYRGIQQPDPTKDGYHSYLVTAACPHCNFRIVTLHKEDTKV